MQGCELWTLSAPAPAQEAQAQAQVERQLKFISFLLFSSKDPNLISKNCLKCLLGCRFEVQIRHSTSHRLHRHNKK